MKCFHLLNVIGHCELVSERTLNAMRHRHHTIVALLKFIKQAKVHVAIEAYQVEEHAVSERFTAFIYLLIHSCVHQLIDRFIH